MKIVLGLGNPGARYRSTRHNLGFRVIDLLIGRATTAAFSRRNLQGKAWTTEVELAGKTTILAKPRTYMNRSGFAALALCRHYDITPRDLLAVHDDADLALGRIRIRTRGSDAGHRGVRSMIDVLGTQAFPRVRLGVRGPGRGDRDLADYVLDVFEPEERSVAKALVALGADAVETVLAKDLAGAMNLFNSRPALEGEAKQER